MPISGSQVRMARAALQWGVRDLAEKAGMSPNTITAVEGGKEVREATLTALQHVLEVAGVAFIAENGGGAGVRFAKRSRRK